RRMPEPGSRQARLARRFLDTEAQKQGRENVTSAADMAAMLRRIYEGTLIDQASSADMLRILRQRGQNTDAGLDYLGRRLNPRPTIDHLNGVLPDLGVYNDAGIVEPEGRPYILAIFLREQADGRAAEDAIARASASVLSVVTAGR